ncbi:hypothetical protein FRC12_007991, partial [Ceratobasidium sp. 428]
MWLDLVGDYAGDEFFVVDGDSLCQLVLDDSLLVIGKETNPGFQILHALHNFEQAILALKSRGCNFDIVFFDRKDYSRTFGLPLDDETHIVLGNKHGTIWADENNFVASSRLLARQIMKSHASQLPEVSVDGFIGLDDSRWHEYVKAKQPMFILCHSGPNLGSADKKNKIEFHRMILQRTFIRDVLMSRIAISLLNEAKYVDTKVLSFVYERQRLGDTKSGQPESWDASFSDSVQLCDDRYSRLVQQQEPPSPAKDRFSWLSHSVFAFLASSLETVDHALSVVFLASQLVLPYLSIEQRAQTPYNVDSDLKTYLVKHFYPKLFGYLAFSLQDAPFLPDLDGNLFLVILNSVITPTSTLHELVGDAVSTEITAAWASVNAPVPDLGVLSSRFRSTVPVESPPSLETPYELLPFSHPVVDKYLESVAVNISSVSTQNISERTRLERLIDEPFIDEKHWHNAKTILPKHLGGKDENNLSTLTGWERAKQLRRDQKFMTNMQRHAQTLTGAKGNPIQRIVISEVGKISPHNHRPPPDSSTSKAAQSNTKPGKQGKSKGPQLNSADKLKAKIEAEKRTKKASEDEIWWKAQLKELEGVQDLAERIGRVENMLRGKRAEKGWLSVEMSLYRIHLILLAWVGDEKGEDAATSEAYVVRILYSIHTLRNHGDLFPVATQTLALVLSALGFDSFAPPAPKTEEDRELSFKFIKLTKS